MNARRAIVFAFALGAVACARAATAEDPVWAKQPCAHCHMLVSNPETAAQLTTRAGERLHFDDIGCMIEHLSQGSGHVAQAWVRDAQGQWVDALRAHYRTGASTPMGYGIVIDANGSLDFLHAQREVALHRLARNTP